MTTWIVEESLKNTPLYFVYPTFTRVLHRFLNFALFHVGNSHTQHDVHVVA